MSSIVENLMHVLARWLGQEDVGSQGERLAADYLRQKGFRILARNLKNKFGEIDIVAQVPASQDVAVIEVKTRVLQDESSPFTRPEERVSHSKQLQLTKLACQLARRKRLKARVIRFDVVGVDIVPGGQAVIRHHPGAFESTV